MVEIIRGEDLFLKANLKVNFPLAPDSPEKKSLWDFYARKEALSL